MSVPRWARIATVWAIAAGLVVSLTGCGQPAVGTADVTAAGVEAVRAGRSRAVRAERPLTDAEWESLRGLAGLEELVLMAGGADDARAEIIATLADVERLVLRESPLTDAGLRHLAACSRLRDLNLPQSACTAAGIRSLASLQDLRSLRLGGPGLAGPEVCRAVVELPALRSLHFIDVPIGDEGLAVLAGKPTLWNLYLDGAGVSDAAWEGYFRACPDVHVHVDQAHHDRDPRRSHD